MTAAQAMPTRPVAGRSAGLPQEGDAAQDCELCRGAGLCPQCDGYGGLPDGSGPGAGCPLCAGESWCPQCTGTGEAGAVGS